jgi:hypothetical protein
MVVVVGGSHLGWMWLQDQPDIVKTKEKMPWIRVIKSYGNT